MSVYILYCNLYDSFEYKDNEAMATELKWKHHACVTVFRYAYSRTVHAFYVSILKRPLLNE